jgi:hypothetical protein
MPRDLNEILCSWIRRQFSAISIIVAPYVLEHPFERYDLKFRELLPFEKSAQKEYSVNMPLRKPILLISFIHKI